MCQKKGTYIGLLLGPFCICRLGLDNLFNGDPAIALQFGKLLEFICDIFDLESRGGIQVFNVNILV